MSPDTRSSSENDSGEAPPVSHTDAGVVSVSSWLGDALEAWRVRLAAAGVGCKGVALHSHAPEWNHTFETADVALNLAWADLCARTTSENPFHTRRLIDKAGSDVLLACRLQLTGEHQAVVGVVLAPPQSERAIQTVLLGLAALQQSLTPLEAAGNQHAAALLELVGHVSSQRTARAAAQDWVNRTAAWVRSAMHEDAGNLSLSLFYVRNGVPRWWVSSDVAWVETQSTVLQQAGESAARAAIEGQDTTSPGAVTMPMFDTGQVVAVLVVQTDVATAHLSESVLSMLRGSCAVAEPLLRHWRAADRSLWRHLFDATVESWARLWRPGHLVWKFGVGATVSAAVLLTCIPVTDRVTANTVIEGRVRQVVTTPFEGFIARSMVRPGDQVSAGQVLAQLDDRELKLEQARQHSEREQAAGKLRQAMAERDAAQVALTSAELRQAEAQLALVEAKLLRSVLVSPMAGLVVSGDWSQHIGGPVEAGKEMFEIASTTGYRVVLQVPDRDIAHVRPGLPGRLRLTGQPHMTHEFEVTVVTATATVQDGANGFRVEAKWKGDPPSLNPGMQGIGKIEVGRASLLEIWTRSTVDWLRLKLWSWWW